MISPIIIVYFCAINWMPVWEIVAVKSLAILSFAILLWLGLRMQPASSRHLAFALIFCALLALPFLTLMLPPWHIQPGAKVPAPAVRIQALPGVPRPPATDFAANRHVPAPAAAQPVGIEPPLSPVSYTVDERNYARPINQFWVLPIMVVFLTWVAGAVAIGLRYLFGSVLLRRAVRGFPVLQVEEARAILPPGMRRVRVRIGGKMPLNYGWVRPTLVLPEDFMDWEKDRQSAVILHECAHIRRWDWPVKMVAQLACAIYWYNPLVWVIARRMGAEAERACDDRVLLAGVAPADYAEHLVELARALQSGRRAPSGAIAMASRPMIDERVNAILDSHKLRRSVPVGVAIAFAVFAMLALVPLAAARVAGQTDTTKFHGSWQNANGNNWQYRPINPMNLSFSDGLTGWEKGSDFSTAPDYAIGFDSHGYEGRSAGFVRSRNAGPQGHAGLDQGLRLDHYRGKRVRVSAMLRTGGVTGYASLMIHLDTETSYSVLETPRENLYGTTRWQRYDVVLDIPGNAQGLFYGAFLNGAGEIWIADVRVDVVGKAVPETPASYAIQENGAGSSKTDEEPGDGWANWSAANPMPENLDFKSGTDGWFQPPASHGTIVIDPSGGPHGEPCLDITPSTGGFFNMDWASLQQLVVADAFQGRRVRLSALLKADGVKNEADLSMRVGSPEGSPGAQAPTLSGTTGWEPCVVVLDVPADSPGLCIGLSISGGGTVRVADVRLDVVGKDVPLTSAGDSGSYPGDTDRIYRVWLTSRSGRHADALAEAQAIAEDPGAGKEERCTAEDAVAYNAWRLGQPQVAQKALAAFEQQNKGLDIDPGVIREKDRTRARLKTDPMAKHFNAQLATRRASLGKKVQKPVVR